MRDIAVTLAVFGSLPFILKRPWIGIIVWSWLGFMNPHRMAWGFSMTMPFAYIVAVTTLIALAFTKEEKKIPWTRESVTLFMLVLWMTVTTLFAMYGDLAWTQWEKVMKIQTMIFVGMMLITTKERLQWLVFVIAVSIGFYGVKGGIFTILHGGVHRVQGPPGTFIDGNNEIGLALAMTVPLLYYTARYFPVRSLRMGFMAACVLTAIAAIGTQSRGALLGLGAMGIVFIWRSRQKFRTVILIGISVFLIAQVMPAAWYERMSTIQTYDEDRSALGRINSWWMAFNMAKAQPFGGGFEAFQPESFELYGPDTTLVHDAHSIYFEILGEHGFVGLALFLALGLFVWFGANRTRKAAEKLEDMRWMSELCRMVQVSMVAYAAAGMFLGMAYFDYYYNLILIVVVSAKILEKGLAQPNAMPGSDRVEGGAPRRRLLAGS
ncbi:MAG: putative O-glycosylation ligase, exosortase A system-associated [Burkholderiales bacterium]